MTYHHQYPEEVRAKAITRAVAALKRRLLYGHSGINSWKKGQNTLGSDTAGPVEKTSTPTGRG